MDRQLRIVYEDRDLLVAEKPAGLPVQSAGIGTRDAVSLLLRHLTEKPGDTEGGHQVPGGAARTGVSSQGRHPALPYLAVVHRLDQPVQGLLVFAKNKKAAASLSAQVQDGRMRKEYLALVQVTDKGRETLGGAVAKEIIDGEIVNKGTVDEGSIGREVDAAEEILLTDYLIRDGRTNTSRVAQGDEVKRKDAKKAQLILSPQSYPGNSDTSLLLRIHLLTGRHHQIRVQLAHAGLPILGDRKYGQGDAGMPYAALCADRLSFVHPTSGERLVFSLENKNIWFLLP